MPAPRTGSDRELSARERSASVARRAVRPQGSIRSQQERARSTTDAVAGRRRRRRAGAGTKAAQGANRNAAVSRGNAQSRRVGLIHRIRRAARNALRGGAERLNARAERQRNRRR